MIQQPFAPLNIKMEVMDSDQSLCQSDLQSDLEDSFLDMDELGLDLGGLDSCSGASSAPEEDGGGSMGATAGAGAQQEAKPARGRRAGARTRRTRPKSPTQVINSRVS